MIRILNIVGSVDLGGIESFLMNLYRHLDKKKYQFDFVVYQEPKENGHADEIKQLGGQIYIVPPKSEGVVNNLRAIYGIVKENKYQIVWRHTETLFKGLDLWAAKRAGATLTIMHSHNSGASKKEYLLGKIVSPIVNPAISLRWACGKKAGLALFGNHDFEVVHNGLILKQWQYDEKRRLQYRKQFEIEGKTVYGHVGRFAAVKNHIFLLHIFEEILKRDTESRLLLVGDGELKPSIMEEAVRLGIASNIIFAGNRSDVSNIMDAMDVFVFPSIYEGVPVALIEAQSKDLPCLISDTIDRECCVVDENVTFASLKESASKWADIACIMKRNNRTLRNDEIRRAGYDIDDTLKKICSIWSNEYGYEA